MSERRASVGFRSVMLPRYRDTRGMDHVSLCSTRREPARIDWEALPKLTAEDVKDLGVVLGSHCRKLLEAIAALHRTRSAR